jgi:PST family polysaccharide transporter
LHPRAAIGFARLAEDFGLDTVVLQNRELDAERRARLAGFALLLGVGLLLLFVGLAQPIALFNKEPAVSVVVMTLSLMFIIDALQILPRALLQRDLQFRRVAIVSCVQGVVTSSMLAFGAYSGWGFWSLVINTLAGGVASTLLLLWWQPYQIAWPRELGSLVGPIFQGWRVLASRITWYGYNTLDTIIVGNVLGKSALGAYGFAGDISRQPMEEITSIVSRVVPGVFTNVQNNMPAMRRYFLILTELLTYLVFPVGVGIALTADRVVALALGEQWGAVVEPLRILCIYAAFLSSQALVAHILLWTGQFRALMWCSILTVAMLVPAFWFGAKLGGLVGVAWMWTFVFPISNIPPLVIGFRTINIGFGDWFKTMQAALVGCAAMIAVVLTIRFQLSDSLSPWMALGCEAAAGALTYLAILWLLFRRRVLATFDIVRSVREAPPPVAAAAEATAG